MLATLAKVCPAICLSWRAKFKAIPLKFRFLRRTYQNCATRQTSRLSRTFNAILFLFLRFY